MTELTTTLNRIRECSPCESGWEKLLAGLGKSKADDEELPFAKILELNGLDDALWCARVEPQHNRLWRLYAVWCARQVQHLMTDKRLITALDVAERHANGKASDGELCEASIAAGDAAARAARAALAAWIAAGATAWNAAWAVVRGGVYATGDAVLTMQEKFLELVTTGDWS